MNGQLIYSGIASIILGLIMIIFNKWVAKYIPSNNINYFSSSKKSGRNVALWETTEEFYGGKGKKIILWLGVIVLIAGIVILFFGFFS